MRYRDLSYLIGEEVEMMMPAHDKDFNFEPDRIVVENEYPKTLLIRKYYRGTSYLRMVTKAAMYCADVQIRHGIKLLTGKEVLR